MNATEEWLRYVENRSIMNRYGITGYADDKEEDKEDTKVQEENC